MKYLLLSFLLLPFAALAQTSELARQPLPKELSLELDRFMIDRLLTISPQKWKGKTVAELMNNEEATGYTDSFFRYTPEGKVHYMMLQYSPTVFLSVYADGTTLSENPDVLPEKIREQFGKEVITNIGVRFIMMQE